MEPTVQGMKDAVDSAFNFPDMMMRIFQSFFFLMKDTLGNQSLSPEDRLVYSICILIGFAAITFVSTWFAIFILKWVFHGVSRLFTAFSHSLSDPASLPFIAALSIIRATPWYFNVLLVILLFCGILAIIGGNFWAESFKYVLGATVGSLIGVVKKKEEADFDTELFDAARSLSVGATEGKKRLHQGPTSSSNTDKK
jgi:hypothetical protein